MRPPCSAHQTLGQALAACICDAPRQPPPSSPALVRTMAPSRYCWTRPTRAMHRWAAPAAAPWAASRRWTRHDGWQPPTSVAPSLPPPPPAHLLVLLLPAIEHSTIRTGNSDLLPFQPPLPTSCSFIQGANGVSLDEGQQCEGMLPAGLDGWSVGNGAFSITCFEHCAPHAQHEGWQPVEWPATAQIENRVTWCSSAQAAELARRPWQVNRLRDA